MPGRRDVIGAPDQAQIGIGPDSLQDFAQPGERIGLQRARLRPAGQDPVHSDAPSTPGCAALSVARRLSRIREISARASRDCSAPSRVSW